jgi:hypothetical protein
MYASVVINGKIRRVPKKELTRFKLDCEIWGMKHARYLFRVKAKVKEFINNGKEIEVQRYFLFNTSKIYTKEHKPKIFDVSNRVKAIDDAVAKMIGVDDKYTFRGISEKIDCGSNFNPCIWIIIKPMKSEFGADTVAWLHDIFVESNSML